MSNYLLDQLDKVEYELDVFKEQLSDILPYHDYVDSTTIDTLIKQIEQKKSRLKKLTQCLKID